MRSAQCAGGVLCLLALAFEGSALAVTPDEVGLVPGAAGWFGPAWQTDESGALVSSVTVTSFLGDVDQWLHVRVLGVGLDFGWSEGPYPSQETPLTVPVVLPSAASAEGLVQVFVLVEATDRVSGDLLGLEQTPAAYVIDAGTATEAWFDESTATSLVSRNLVVPLEPDTVIDDLVGLEVTR